MAKMIDCSAVDPASGCKKVIFGNDDEEVLRKAVRHTGDHGIRDVTTEMLRKMRAAIRDCPWMILEKDDSKGKR